MGVLKDGFDEIVDNMRFMYEEGGIKDVFDIVKSVNPFKKREGRYDNRKIN